MHIHNILRETSSVLLDERSTEAQLEGAIKAYKTFLIGLSGFDDNDVSRENINAEYGEAIGATWAAMCIEDVKRTSSFVRGLFHAVKSKEQNDKPVHILYAGTGPFAALILPQLIRYDHTQIQITFLEINHISYSCLKRLIGVLGLEKYVKHLLNTDASKYRIPKDDKIDIVISETMQHALQKEMQVPIMLNLFSQLPDDVIMIPAKIELHVGLLHLPQSNAAGALSAGCISYTKIQKVFELTLGSLQKYMAGREDIDQIVFPEVAVTMLPDKIVDFNFLAVFTSINIFGNESLETNESGLTTPMILREISAIKNHKFTVTCQYEIISIPGIRHSIDIS